MKTEKYVFRLMALLVLYHMVFLGPLHDNPEERENKLLIRLTQLGFSLYAVLWILF
jgi:hypothetical protein